MGKKSKKHKKAGTSTGSAVTERAPVVAEGDAAAGCQAQDEEEGVREGDASPAG